MIAKKYLNTGEGAVASYNWTDISEGTGIVTFYGYTHKETTTMGYAISQTADYADQIYTEASSDVTSPTKLMDLDFDTSPFNLPKKIKGKVKITLTVGGGAKTAGTSRTADIYVIAKVRKWNGTTETEIANATSKTVSVGAGGTGKLDFYTMNFEVNVATIQNFKKGETLRVTLEYYGTVTGATTTVTWFYLMHDPMNRTTSYSMPAGESGTGATADTIILKMHIPFVLDL